MPNEPQLFVVDCRDSVVIVTPTGDLSEFQFKELTLQANQAFNFLETSDKVSNIVLDFQHTRYFGSTALGLFVQLWLRVSPRGGKMAFCNLTEQERDILKVTQLNSMWFLCDDLDSAIQKVTE